MIQNKPELFFYVNIAMSCFGIYMLYKASKVNENIEESVKTYIEKKSNNDLDGLIDIAVTDVKQDNQTKIETIVINKIKDMINNEVIEEMTKQKIKEKIQEVIDKLEVSVLDNNKIDLEIDF